MEATRKLVEAVRGQDLEAARLAHEAGASPNHLEAAHSVSILNETASWIEDPGLRQKAYRRTRKAHPWLVAPEVHIQNIIDH